MTQDLRSRVAPPLFNGAHTADTKADRSVRPRFTLPKFLAGKISNMQRDKEEGCRREHTANFV